MKPSANHQHGFSCPLSYAVPSEEAEKEATSRALLNQGSWGSVQAGALEKAAFVRRILQAADARLPDILCGV